ncbi:MAG TPA: thiamine pyrophosphate-dependent enzyme [Gemmataceae bacterium]|nr:thiamine pyrophosphate-dependent enzyme [Gemmataceae bacterium]
MAKTVADLLVERLLDWGVKVIFGLPGDGINGFFEALRQHQDKIQFIQVRHEEAAAFAACGYAKTTGSLGVCVATSGPGGIHLLNGLYDAKYDGQPVLAITGHTFHDLIGTHFQQDVDLDKVFMDVCEYNERLMGPNHVHNIVDEAIRTALARRGVAHVTIPKDIQEWPSDLMKPSTMNIPHHSGDNFAPASSLPSRELLQQAADLLNQGKKPAILVGRGAYRARNEVLQVAEKLGAPIIYALLGKGVVPDEHPNVTGGLGLLGTAPSMDAMKECDTFFIIGSNFPYQQFLPQPGQAKCMQIDIDAARIGLRYPVDVPLVGDTRRVLEALIGMVQPKSDKSFLEKIQKNRDEWDKLMEERASRMDKPMKPQVVTKLLNKFLADDHIIISDCGTVTTWSSRYIKMRDRQMFTCTGMLATMANGLPYSVGAAFAHPGRQILCYIGDGGFTMLMCELATIVKYKLPVKVVVIKNNTLGQIKWEQIVMESNPEFGCDLHPIDFAKYAEAVGCPGFTIDDPKKAEATLKEAFAVQGPAVIQAVVDPHEPPMPGHVQMSQAYQFAKALIRGEKYAPEIIKTVLENKIKEVV